jgi:predicted aspartyl protease
MAKELGGVNDEHEPIVTVEFVGGGKIDCIVDTGFNGTLFLPQSFIDENDFALIGNEEFKSVGQDEAHSTKLFSGAVKWLGDEFEISILMSERNFALIGAEMLIDARLEIDYAASTVVIEKVR